MLFVLVLKVFQFWPLGTLPVSTCVPLTYPIIMRFFEHFFSFWYYKMLHVYHVTSLSQP